MGFPYDNQNNPGQSQEALRANAGQSTAWIQQLFGNWQNMFNTANRGIPSQAPQTAPAAIAYDPYNTGWDKNNDPVMARTNRGAMINSPNQAPAAHYSQPSGDVLAALNGKFNASDNSMQGVPLSLQRPQEVDPLDARLAEIQKLMQGVNMEGDPAAFQGDVDAAFAGSFGAINNARARAKEGYNESDNVLANLTKGHVDQIQHGDRAAIGKANDDLVGGLDKTYKQANTDLSADRQKEISAKTEMLSRLGLQEAGIGSAGKEQTEAISRMTQQQAGAKDQAAGYRQADMVRNTELASSQADAGLERRAALRRDLDKINGNLDNSAATVENAKAQAMLSGKNASKADGMKMLEFYQNQIKDISDTKERREQTSYDRGIDARDFAAKSQGGGGVYEAVKQSIQNTTGQNAQPYMEAYTDVVSKNGYDSRSGADKIAFYQQAMIKAAKDKGVNLDPQTALSFITGVENYGTDKLK